MKTELNSYVVSFLNEVINAKKVASVPGEEIFILKKTLGGLK